MTLVLQFVAEIGREFAIAGYDRLMTASRRRHFDESQFAAADSLRRLSSSTQ
jgi:hypothetical protein